ncbi:hypothetical protein BTIS_1928 [Bifidobacterium tissieri]|uniref:Uncharacterized protein n=1 Tax=Bifidobacterium tissieri TaxID=1630162 RepID=A0A261F973_9BIFI|nr:hypothetical protein BTIS_1928 [Bifidobacterium tissieri]
MCGANSAWTVDVNGESGSSPRVRGKPAPALARPTLVRIIPACAGQTHRDHPCHPSAPDHPRVCGANSPCGPCSPCGPGSSPRVRGKRAILHTHTPQFRIIPACAGQTSPYPFHWGLWSDHPRVCGANLDPVLLAWPVRGSSPRVRGKPGSSPPTADRTRIIPACAGQTDIHPLRRSRESDHPRVCGANSGYWEEGQKPIGSSPRVRGKRRASTRGR